MPHSSAYDSVEVRILLAATGADATGFASAALLSLSEPLDAASRNGMRSDALVADMNNDGRADIVLWFVRRTGVQNQIFQRLLRSDATVAGTGLVLQAEATLGAYTDRYNTNPATARFSVAARDIDSDGWNDLLVSLLGQDFNTPAADERAVMAELLNTRVADGVTFAFGPTFVHSAGPGWRLYDALVGDFDGDGDTDLAWLRTDATTGGTVHQAAYDGASRAFVQRGSQTWATGANADVVNVKKLLANNDQLFVVDSNGDSAADVVATKYLSVAGQSNYVNGVAVMKGVRNGSPMFNVSASAQQHPVNQDWQNFTYVFVGDFNGDGLQDILWNNAALDNAVYVAFAKRENDQPTL